MNKMSLPSRLVVGIGSLALIASYFFPVWFIFLLAPQYPEGLTMNIWLNKITGQVDIINGLNHYIGMKHIKAEMFPEFQYLVYVVGFYILFGLVVAITGKRKLLFVYLVLSVCAGLAAMYDFYQWSYDYGHNLDPKAAIQIPGFSYQPPLIGHKTLLNFDAYSYPDTGGWVFIIIVFIFLLVWLYEFKRARQTKKVATINPKFALISVAFILFSFSSCNTNPEPLVYGKDVCTDCKMTIMDPKFGGEIISKKGKIFKFDDAHCMVSYLKKGGVKTEDIAQTLFVEYGNNKNFIDVHAAFFVVSAQIKSPMNSNAAAFPDQQSAKQTADNTAGEIKNWNALYNSL